MSATDSGLEFILSGHTAAQLQVLGQLSSILSAATNPLLYVEGPHRIWINKSAVNYFSLRLSANDSKHVRNNAEGVLYMCVCARVHGVWLCGVELCTSLHCVIL